MCLFFFFLCFVQMLHSLQMLVRVSRCVCVCATATECWPVTANSNMHSIGCKRQLRCHFAHLCCSTALNKDFFLSSHLHVQLFQVSHTTWPCLVGWVHKRQCCWSNWQMKDCVRIFSKEGPSNDSLFVEEYKLQFLVISGCFNVVSKDFVVALSEILSCAPILGTQQCSAVQCSASEMG